MARWYSSKMNFSRGRKRILKLTVSILIIGMIGVLFFRIIDRNLKPTIIQIAETRAHIIATETMNKALYDKVLKGADYEDLMNVHKDSQQRITMVQANTIKISRIVSEANLVIKESLKNLEDETIIIPFGQALGSPLLAHYGPDIKVKLIPVGTVNVGFVDRFQEAGINQVRHILYLDIETTVKIVVPLVTDNVIVCNQIPIAETIIIGDVPNTYIGLDSGLGIKDIVKEKIEK